MAKKQTILVTEVYIDKKFAGKTVEVLDNRPDWFRRIFLAVVVPVGFWVMVIQGVFRG